MNPHDSSEELKMKVARSVSMAGLSRSAYLLGWAAAFLLLIACVATLGQTSGGQEAFVRQSTPELLTFDEPAKSCASLQPV